MAAQDPLQPALAPDLSHRRRGPRAGHRRPWPDPGAIPGPRLAGGLPRSGDLGLRVRVGPAPAAARQEHPAFLGRLAQAPTLVGQGACAPAPVSYTHLRAHETDSYLVCRLLLEKKKTTAA